LEKGTPPQQAITFASISTPSLPPSARGKQTRGEVTNLEDLLECEGHVISRLEARLEVVATVKLSEGRLLGEELVEARLKLLGRLGSVVAVVDPDKAAVQACIKPRRKIEQRGR
jgi:hypothetical protein